MSDEPSAYAVDYSNPLTLSCCDGDRERYVKLRSHGHSIRFCARELGIAKSTAERWEADAKQAIADMMEAELAEVYDLYGVNRLSMIKRIGDELAAVEGVLEFRRSCGNSYYEESPLRGSETVETYDRDVLGHVVKRTVKRRENGCAGYWSVPTEKLVELELKLLHELERLYVPLSDAGTLDANGASKLR